MRKESEITSVSSDSDEGLLKSGTRINSIIQRIRVLSRIQKSEVRHEGASETAEEEDQHISFTSADSKEREPHSVNFDDPDDPYERDSRKADHESNESREAGSRGCHSKTSEITGYESDNTVVRQPQKTYLTETELKVPRALPINETSESGQDFDKHSGETNELLPVVPEFVLSPDDSELEAPGPIITNEIRKKKLVHDDEIYPVEVSERENNMFEQHNTEQNEDNEVHEHQAGNHEHIENQFEEESAVESYRESSNDEADVDRSLSLTAQDIDEIRSPRDFVNTLHAKGVKAVRFEKNLRYEETMRALQAECVKLQRSVKRHNEQVVVIFEGMELSGKFETIRKFTKYMDPRSIRVVSLSERTQEERQEWYFQRYTKHLPKPGEIVFFNRSWYDRGVLEPIHGLCTDKEYGNFLSQAPEFEYMLIENGYKVIKIWLSISAKQQRGRLNAIGKDPLKNWKATPFDESYLERWDNAQKYRDLMFSWTDKKYSPWMIVSSKKRKLARMETMRYVLSTLDYDGKEDAEVSLKPDASIVRRFHRSMITSD